MSKLYKYLGLILICGAFGLEYTKMSPDKIMLQVPMVIAGSVMFIEYLQKDIVESIVRKKRPVIIQEKLNTTKKY